MSRAAGPCDSFNQSLGCVLHPVFNTVYSPQVSDRKEAKPDTRRIRDYVFGPRARLCSLPNVAKDSE
ncbi:hypothetical protein WH47_09703 [Habropoda laboriosa]|uniref:Uncharacterized protein n=1 Tax=Habropoda laboriosa TaxID=597456 RepID=A0A0L7QM78_9HYME|nr:hypothetical protein WH47_09703 [Habropoda laboriosa]